MVIIKQIEEVDIDRVYDLHNEFYQDQRTVENWKHTYLSYIPDNFVFSIAMDGKKIVGTQGMIPVNLNINNQIIISGKSENSLVDPNYQGQKLFSRLYDDCLSIANEKSMKIIWGLTTWGDLWKKSLKFETYGGVYSRCFGIISLKSALLNLNHFKIIRKASKSRKILYSVGFIPLMLGYKIYSTIRKMLQPLNHNLINLDIKTSLNNDDDIIMFFERQRKKFPKLIHIEQDSNYLSWRVYNNPQLNYSTYFIYQDKELKGYCYYTIDKNTNSVYLTDFTCENFEIGKALLKVVMKELHYKKISYLTYFGNSENILIQNTISLLKRVGLRFRLTPTFIVLKNIGGLSNEIVYDIQNWHINGLWTEGFTV